MYYSGCDYSFCTPACNANNTSRHRQTLLHQQVNSQARIPSSTSQKDILPISIDIDALMQGNYDSILATWQNTQGDSLTFNSKGLVTEECALLDAEKLWTGI